MYCHAFKHNHVRADPNVFLDTNWRFNAVFLPSHGDVARGEAVIVVDKIALRCYEATSAHLDPYSNIRVVPGVKLMIIGYF